MLKKSCLMELKRLEVQLCQISLNPTACQSDISWKYGLASIIYPLVYRGNRFWKSQKLDVKLHGWHDLCAWEIQSLTVEVYRVLVSLVMVSASRPAARWKFQIRAVLKTLKIMWLKGWVKGWLKLLFKIRVIFWAFHKTDMVPNVGGFEASQKNSPTNP